MALSLGKERFPIRLACCVLGSSPIWTVFVVFSRIGFSKEVLCSGLLRAPPPYTVIDVAGPTVSPEEAPGLQKMSLLFPEGRPASPRMAQVAGNAALPSYRWLRPHQTARAGGAHPGSQARRPSSVSGRSHWQGGAPSVTGGPAGAGARRWRAGVTH